MYLLRLPGVYRPQADTELLLRAAADPSIPRGGRVLDMCTGTGALAIHAACGGAGSVTAVDISWRALVSTWLNCRFHGVRVELRHEDSTRLEHDGGYDLILANPPYVPGPNSASARGRARAWDAGPLGRDILDPLCRILPRLLNPNATGLIVHSALCDPDLTIGRLRAGGLKAAVVAQTSVEFGPVLRSRAGALETAGLLGSGQHREQLVVVRADRPDSIGETAPVARGAD
ncbi:methyltransferase [Nocardia vermiculata]|uniref:Methyltransferase n=2 Tax=Nocardia vermiculata TaxID=257274 RepID=A0A846Y498_9NOCA|nr:methyltransferase [Nocardia vermiculata]